jgi:hypothetical protein
MQLIGRREEKDQFNRIMASGSSEFVAVFGRRRVGKTYLIRQYFDGKLSFSVTGMANVDTSAQLMNFHLSLHTHGNTEDQPPASWLQAFHRLQNLLEGNSNERKVVFIDEMPWLDTPRSNFISALEHFWNSWAAHRGDIVLIVCGSAASWIINELINNKGGLHNRVTCKMKIEAFRLAEVREFLRSKQIPWNEYQIVQTYMVTGGIPFYLNALEKEQSAVQNINRLCFKENGLLKTEFGNLYASLFRYPEKHVAIVEALSLRSMGMTREEILTVAKIPNGGTATKALDELEACGFIRKYTPYGRKYRESMYQLVDFYTLFYYQFIERSGTQDENYWLNIIDHPQTCAWSGYAFELVCLMHVREIKQALGISGVQSEEYAWRSKELRGGAQVDLLIDRRDQVINLFEMKFSINPYTIDAKYAATLQNKVGLFRSETGTRKAVYLSMLTTYGLRQNAHSGMVQNDLTMACLFLDKSTL